MHGDGAHNLIIIEHKVNRWVKKCSIFCYKVDAWYFTINWLKIKILVINELHSYILIYLLIARKFRLMICTQHSHVIIRIRFPRNISIKFFTDTYVHFSMVLVYFAAPDAASCALHSACNRPLTTPAPITICRVGL